ncbi:MAG: YceD family protein [Acidimicrobiales bacterium]
MGASPFLVSVTELVKHPGTRRPTEVAGPIEGLAITSARVPAGADVAFVGVLESIADGSITATGAVRAPWAGECRRCLAEMAGELVTDVREVFARDGFDGETYPLDRDRVELLPMVHDAVLLALPLAPLCDGDCAGPDPEAHPVAVAAADVPANRGDPRWAGLSDLRFD